MNLFDDVIAETMELLARHAPRKLAVENGSSWELREKNELVLAKEAAFELGANGLPSVGFSCVTSSSDLVREDEILLIGPDLGDIGSDVPFARLVFFRTGAIEPDAAYKTIRDLEYLKYGIIPRGYMVRSSCFDRREQVRVSGDAIAKGLDFKTIGNIYLGKYRERAAVGAARVVFVTEDIPAFPRLAELSAKTESVTKALDRVLSQVAMDCASCNLKPVCDEVEGLKELHFGKAKGSVWR